MRFLVPMLVCLLSSVAFGQTPPLWKPESSGSTIIVPVTTAHSVRIPSGQFLLKSSGTGNYSVLLKSAEALGADRDLTLALGAANRLVTLTGNPTLGDWFNQPVKTTSGVTFSTVSASFNGQIGATTPAHGTFTGLTSPTLAYAGHIDITPSGANWLDLNYGDGADAGAVRFNSNRGEGIRLERTTVEDAGTIFNYYTNSNAKWSLGPMGDSDDYRLYGNAASNNAFIVESADNTMTIQKLEATNAVFVTPTLGTPASGTLENCTGLPVGTGISGFGTGVATALGINVGTAGSVVVNGGALGTPASGAVTNLTGTASININGTVGATTPAAGTFTDLTSSGTTTLGDVAGDTVVMNAQNITCPLRLIYSKTAQASIAETLATYTISDDTSSTFAIANGSATDATFTPKFTGTQSGTGVGIQFVGVSTTDTGASPVMLFSSQIGAGAVATRPVMAFRNLATDMAQFTASSNFALKGGATSPAKDAAAADTVAIVGVDNGVGNRELQVQPESGGYFAMGNNQFRRVATANQDVYHWATTVNTTNATQATVATIPITANRTYMIETRVAARRTGGTAGTADDGASYVRRGTYTTKSGTVTLMGPVETIGTDAEDQAGWDVTLDVSTTNVRVRVTGAADNNVTWSADSTVQSVAQ